MSQEDLGCLFRAPRRINRCLRLTRREREREIRDTESQRERERERKVAAIRTTTQTRDVARPRGHRPDYYAQDLSFFSGSFFLSHSSLSLSLLFQSRQGAFFKGVEKLKSWLSFSRCKIFFPLIFGFTATKEEEKKKADSAAAVAPALHFLRRFCLFFLT